MPNRPPMTDDQKAQAIQLRSEGLPYVKIAAKIGTSESAAFKYLSRLSKPLTPKPAIQKQPKRKRRPASLSPLHHRVASVPMRRRHINPQSRNTPQLTHQQLIDDLAQAVRNTARL